MNKVQEENNQVNTFKMAMKQLTKKEQKKFNHDKKIQKQKK